MIDGTVRVVLAEALLLPTGIVTAVVLTRRLGPEGYGYLTLVSTIVNWIEVGIALVLSPVAIKLVSQSENWLPIGTSLVRLYLTISSLAALIVWFSATTISSTLREPLLAPYFRLLALEIPLFSLAQAHADILVATGRFRQQAAIRVGRWLARMVLIVLLVEMGLSVRGAILGAIGATAVELALARLYVRPSFFHKASLTGVAMLGFGGPIFLAALSVYLHNRVDIVALKLLGGTAEQAGLYGAAQNISFIPGILAFSFPPILLSTLNRLRHAGEALKAREIARGSLCAVIWLAPFAGAAAGAAPEIVALLFGPKFLPAAPLLSLLIFGALAAVMIAVDCAMLIAANRTGWVFALTGPLVPMAVAGHLFMIPRFGALGASLVTTTVAFVGALATVLTVRRVWEILLPLRTVGRSLAVCALAYGLASLCPAPGFWLILKLALISLVIGVLFVLLGEFSRKEIMLSLPLILQKGDPEPGGAK